MKNLINNWLQSKKYIELKNQLDEKRSKFLGSIAEVSKFKKINAMPKLTKNELIQQVDVLLKFSQATDFERYEYEHKTFLVFSTTDKTALFYELSNQLICWYFYLSEQSSEEEYELCAKIRDSIEIEKHEFLQALIKYCPSYEEIIDEELIKDIDAQIKKTFI